MNPVQLREELAHHALGDAAAAASRALHVTLPAGIHRERVDLVEENHAGTAEPRLAEDRGDGLLALSDVLGIQFRSLDGDEVHVRLGGDRFREKRFRAAWRTVQQNALRWRNVEPRELGGEAKRPLQELAEPRFYRLEPAELPPTHARGRKRNREQRRGPEPRHYRQHRREVARIEGDSCIYSLGTSTVAS